MDTSQQQRLTSSSSPPCATSDVASSHSSNVHVAASAHTREASAASSAQVDASPSPADSTVDDKPPGEWSSRPWQAAATSLYYTDPDDAAPLVGVGVADDCNDSGAEPETLVNEDKESVSRPQSRASAESPPPSTSELSSLPALAPSARAPMTSNVECTADGESDPAQDAGATAPTPALPPVVRRVTPLTHAPSATDCPVITMRMPTEAVHSGLLPTYKILVVGDAGVGKTNLLGRYCTDQYDPMAAPTLGVEFFSRELDVPSGPVGQVDTVVVQLWDTAGQERSSMISSAFFRNAVGALLVFDVSRRDTLLNIPKWAAHVRAVASEDCVCFVVGNKSDLWDEDVDGTGVSAAATSGPHPTMRIAEAEEIAHSLDMRLFMTSAKRGDGVLGAFTSMVLSVNAVQSVKRNGPLAMQVELSGAQSGKAHQQKPARAQRRKSVLDLRGFGSAGAGGEGGNGTCAWC